MTRVTICNVRSTAFLDIFSWTDYYVELEILEILEPGIQDQEIYHESYEWLLRSLKGDNR